MSQPTNEDRTERANQTLDFYATLAGESLIEDLLADLMHYCAENGTDFDASLSMARMHFTNEVEEEAEED